MTKSEFRVGDWINRIDIETPYAVRVVGVELVNRAKDKYVVYVDNMHGSIINLYVDEVEAIPITEENLIKNGFVLEKDGYVYYAIEGNKEQDYIAISFRHNGEVRYVEVNFTNKCQCLYKTINYIHELQHILNDCKIGKKFEL